MADVALTIDARGFVRAAAVESGALLRDIGHWESWLGHHWREAVTTQSRPVAESLLEGQPSNISRLLRHVDHVSGDGLTVPVVYWPLPLGDDGESGGLLLLGRDLRGMDFTSVLLRADPAAASAYAKAMSTRGTDARTLCLDVLAPAARRLGVLWAEDVCSFVEVTAGLGSLHQIVRELAPPARESGGGGGPGRRILLALAPGEQHGFGLSIVRQFFSRADWAVDGGESMSARDAIGLVRKDHYDVVGISAASESRFSALAAAIQELRSASRNPGIRVMVGGQVFVGSPELVAGVGADMTAGDARHAVMEAERLAGAAVAR